MKTYGEIQKVELETWNIEDDAVRKEKAQREKIRYPYIKRLMGLSTLDTSDMVVFDIGAGPLGGVSQVIEAKKIVRIDPLASDYARFYPIDSTYMTEEAENLDAKLGEADLIVITNALDHFRDPHEFLHDMVQYGKPGLYFAHAHAIDNAKTHPHEAHEHNINPDMIQSVLASDFELVWNYDFAHDGARYGWVPHKGRAGQPAFYQLWRKVTGYKP